MTFSQGAGLKLPGPDDLARLSQALSSSALYVHEAARERFDRDESTRLVALPTAVVVPECEEDVATVLAWANEGSFPIIPRGAGTGVAGGAVAVGGGVVLSLEKLNKIIEIDEDNLTATCQVGVINQALKDECAKLGLFYPPDPASADVSTLGGNVVVGAGGMVAVKYGTTSDYVLGMRVVTPQGETLDLGGKNVKDATGYHLLELMIGSEGTLAVATRVTLKLLPLPANEVSLLIPFDTILSAANFVSQTIKARIIPAAVEFMDDVSIRAAKLFLGRDLPFADTAGAYVFVLLHGDTLDELNRQMEIVAQIADENGSLEILGAEDRGQQERLWESRKTLGKAVKSLSGEVGKADVVVPRASIPSLIASVKEISRSLGVEIACFGHAGDGNVHVNVLRGGLPRAEWDEALEKSFTALMKAVKTLGGRPSGEHGIGVLKRKEMADFVGDEQLRLMRGIKAVFDPKGILNPGKVL